MTRKGFLSITDETKNFFRLPLSQVSGVDNKKIITHINEVWTEIGYLIFMTELVRHRIYNEEDYNTQKEYLKPDLSFLIGTMNTLAHCLYVNFGTIQKILEVSVKKKVTGISKKSYEEFMKDVGDKIRNIRNHLVIHRDKIDFYTMRGQVWTSDDDAMDFEFTISDKTGKQQVLRCNPLIDGEKLKGHLSKILNL